MGECRARDCDAVYVHHERLATPHGHTAVIEDHKLVFIRLDGYHLAIKANGMQLVASNIEDFNLLLVDDSHPMSTDAHSLYILPVVAPGVTLAELLLVLKNDLRGACVHEVVFRECEVTVTVALVVQLHPGQSVTVVKLQLD